MKFLSSSRYIIILLAVITLLSCSSTKHVGKNTSKNVKQAEPEKTDEVINLKKDVIISEEKKIDEAIKEIPKKIESTKTNHSSWNTLLQKHVSNKGHVDYKAFKSNRNELTNYITYLGNHIPQDSWTREDKLAYWINAYNAMTIDLILRHYPIKSIKDIKNPWDQRFWKLGKKWYNLNEIEHQILRKMDEPRIHFAIVCASFSCPKLQNEAFTPSSIDDQLTNATKVFLADKKRNDISQNSLRLSKIFQWFAKDFKQTGTLIDFLNQYSEITISDKAKKNFKVYNWNLNE
ncbi:DUF547 domain-containing protein [Flavivirga spongiicola]|uniref:DUF547 domain-containing protein n=1 Tax=Flavivirga spongiicola TaxID=421621 RepID=A0ABU7XQV7_9FLAO|nr:DUF547 domain-containing protein [Flavivirga sp. MEBiC05379]MDO5978147.1 DUF547 domain-containing protein [Flavivirga sp. MEBiC05379]